LEEMVVGLAEATKISLAAQVARLITPHVDEDGMVVPREDIDNEMSKVFGEVMDEFDATLNQILTRMALLKQNG
jgi:hypothetical protein